jgi:hypothetical protein
VATPVTSQVAVPRYFIPIATASGQAVSLKLQQIVQT